MRAARIAAFLAALMRSALKKHYGITEEKLSEFGLQPFRGRARKKAAPEEPQPPETPPPVAGNPVKPVE